MERLFILAIAHCKSSNSIKRQLITVRRVFCNAAIVTLLLAASFSGRIVIAQQASPAYNSPPGGGGGGGTGSTNFVTTYYEQSNLTRSGETIKALGPDLMGDIVNEYSGSLEFAQTDVSLPGNNGLSVAVGRHLTAGTKQASLAEGLFGDWELEIPHLHTLAVDSTYSGRDWYGISADGTTLTESRCSGWGSPPIETMVEVAGTGVLVSFMAWWDGYHLYTPHEGDQSLIGRYPYTGYVPGTPPYTTDPEQPTDGASYPVLTKNHWDLSCLSTLAVGTGEGFVAHGPDGVTQYQFDHMVFRTYVPYIPPVGSTALNFPRVEIWILPSQITDRFGNWVRYTYDTTDPWKVLSITSSDGRSITFYLRSGHPSNSDGD